MHNADVTIVVVPRDHFSHTRESLESIYAHSDVPFALIYVDGRSPHATARYLREQSAVRHFRLIRVDHYLSPNHARNLGAQDVQTRYTVFIDNDVVVAPNWLSFLLACAEATGAAITSPLNFEKRPLHTEVHFSGGEARVTETTLNGRTERHIVDETFKNIPPERQPTGCAEFHCMMVRTEDFRRVGGLDEKMLSTRENLDFCMTIAAAGGVTYIEPMSQVTYLPPEDMALTDVPYFALRWSDEWDVASFDHFRNKWSLDNDRYFQDQYRNVGWRRRDLMMLGGILGWLPSLRMRIGAERALRPIERRINRIIAQRHARKHPFGPASH